MGCKGTFLTCLKFQSDTLLYNTALSLLCRMERIGLVLMIPDGRIGSLLIFQVSQCMKVPIIHRFSND